LWQLSVCWRDEADRPVKVLSWSPTKWRKAEAVRDKTLKGVGTDEPWIEEQGLFAVHYRRPLRIDEVNRMAPTPEVLSREGRG
jgi:hypothetical protein